MDLINETLLLREFLYNTKFMVKSVERDKELKYDHRVYIILTNTNTLMGKIIKNVTRSEYNHASLALDPTFNHVYGFGRNTDEAESGFIIEKMDGGIYRDNKADYCQLELKVTRDEYEHIKDTLKEFERKKTKFSFNKLGLFFNALNIPYNRKYEFFCSQFIGYVLKSAGIELFNKNYGLVRPNDFLIHPSLKIIKKGNVLYKAIKDKKGMIKNG